MRGFPSYSNPSHCVSRDVECGACVQGAEAALRALATGFGAQLFQKLPRLWELASAAISLRPGIMQAPSADTQVDTPTAHLKLHKHQESVKS